MKLLSIFVASVMFFFCAHARAETCVGLNQILVNAPKNMTEFFKNFYSTVPPCASAKAVAGSIVNRGKTGGRKLEGDKPLDLKEAQANLDSALKNPEIKARMEKARRDITDENVRLAYEAAILDDEGFYSARELKIQQLLQRLN